HNFSIILVSLTIQIAISGSRLTLLPVLQSFVYAVFHPGAAHFPAGQFFSLDGCSGGRKACPGTTDSLGRGHKSHRADREETDSARRCNRAAGRWASMSETFTIGIGGAAGQGLATRRDILAVPGSSLRLRLPAYYASRRM